MKVLVVYAHPSPTSFCHALFETALSALRDSGHDVDVIDLHGIGFDPILSEAEWRNHHLGVAGRNRDALDHASRLQAAEALVLVHPTWWGGHPAILKGWFDRVLCAGVAYDLPDGHSRPRPLLAQIRQIDVITTHGAQRRVNLVQGEPGLHFARSGLRSIMHRRCIVRVNALYGLDTDDAAARAAFIEHIEHALGRDFAVAPATLDRLRSLRRPLRVPLGPLSRLRR